MIFVSKTARKLRELQQRHFLAHVAAPSSTLAGLKESFESGTPVTAKIALMERTGESQEGTVTGRWGKKGDDPAEKGNVCWVSATPLLNADDNVGVWMVVIVDKKSVPLNKSRIPDTLSDRKENGRPQYCVRLLIECSYMHDRMAELTVTRQENCMAKYPFLK